MSLDTIVNNNGKLTQTTQDREILTPTQRMKSATRLMQDDSTYLSALGEMLETIKKEVLDLSESHVPDEQINALKTILNQADSIRQYLDNSRKEGVKTLTCGIENGSNKIIHLYKPVNDAFNVIAYANEDAISLNKDKKYEVSEVIANTQTGPLKILKNIDSLAGIKVNANETNLKRALTNIFSYAQTKTTAGTITLGAELLDSEIKLYVQDTGKGMEVEDCKKLKMFQLTRNSQTKLQDLTCKDAYKYLETAQSLTEKLNGRFEINSEPGKGTTISMYLPKLPEIKYT